jgi:hypothetical protein
VDAEEAQAVRTEEGREFPCFLELLPNVLGYIQAVLTRLSPNRSYLAEIRDGGLDKVR